MLEPRQRVDTGALDLPLFDDDPTAPEDEIVMRRPWWPVRTYAASPCMYPTYSRTDFAISAQIPAARASHCPAA